MDEHISQEDLIAFQLELLDTEQTADIRLHLSKCQACTEELQTLQSIDEGLKVLSVKPSSEQFAENVKLAFLRRKTSSFEWFRYAIIFSVVICISILLLSWNQSSQSQIINWWNYNSANAIQMLWVIIPMAFLYGLDVILQRRLHQN